TNGAVESTLRCTMVYDREVAETLFRGVLPPPAGAGVEPLTRVRPLAAGDQPPELPSQPAPWRTMLRRREVAIVVPLLILAVGLSAWRSGLLDRLLAASARGLELRTGAFGDLLALEAESSWGDYEVALRRGPGYPTTSAAWEARQREAVDEADRLPARLVREGQEIWVQLCDDDGEVLAETGANLRALVAAADGVVEVRVPGRMNATRIVLSVEEHGKK
ncbi:MAG: hypothetical protein KDE27_23090, partial [Planctomycetes bacterium]|nr:hypothetical protein [Planctomycetota bacterium]